MSIIQGNSKTSAAAAYEIDQSIRFNDDDSAHLSRTPSSSGSATDWTLSTWVKLGNLGTDRVILSAGTGGNHDWIQFQSNDTLRIVRSGSSILVSNQVFRDPSGWGNLVVESDIDNATASEKLKVYWNGSEITSWSTDTRSSYSSWVYFNQNVIHNIGRRSGSNDRYFDGYMAEINFIDGTALDASNFGETNSTTGQWVPIEYTNAAGYGSNGFYIDGADSSFLGKDAKATSAAVTNKASTSSEWGGQTGAYTFATNEIDRSSTINAIISTDLLSGDFSFDFTMTTAGGALRVGVIDDQEFNTFNGTGSDGGMDSMTNSWYLDKGNNQFRYGGASQGSASGVVNGAAVTIERTGSTIKITDDGSDAHTFSQTFSGPVRVVISGGGAAFNLDDVQYTADGASANDSSYFSSGLAAADQVTDSPTDNYGVMNPLDNGRPSNITLSDGNLTAAFSGAGYEGGIRSSIFFDSEDSDGWYAECTLDSLAFASIFRAGVANASLDLSSTDAQNDANGWAYSDQGAKLNNSYTTGYGSSVTVGDVVGIAVRNGKIYFAVNNTWQGSADPVAESNPAFSNLLGDVAFCQSTNTGGSYAHTATWNFGQTGFTYTPPTGYKSLRVQDLDDPTIADPSAYFQTTLYTGNGVGSASGGQEINQSGNSTFQPDFVWIKCRSLGTESHNLQDVIRGANKRIQSNNANAEGTETEGLLSFDSDGFTVGNRDPWNKNTATYVGWQWLADNTTGSTNTDGSINSTVSNNSTSNFSIVKYTGTGSGSPTVGHGLGVTPDMIIIKHLDRAQNWRVFHTSEGAGETGFLNSTAAFTADPDRISAVSSTTFTAAANMNESADYIAYCFAEVEGFSKFGSYTGNGSTDGPFVNTGFEVGFLMYKRTNATESWEMYDNTRGFNVHKFNLRANLTNAEQSDIRVDLLSNGFKARSSNTAINASGSTYIYMAFASSPFKTATAQ